MCSKPPVESFLNKIATDIAEVWAAKPLFFEEKFIFMDLPQWSPNSQTESGEHVVPYLRNRLEYLRVNVNPVVRYDFWDDPIYISAVKGIKLENDRNHCIRLDMDVDTVADIMADPDYVTERLSDIIRQLELNPAETYLLIDFGDVSRQLHPIEEAHSKIEEMVNNAKHVISLAQKLGFSQIMLAGSSLPSSINLAVKEQNQTGLVLRKEMMAWQKLLSENPSLNIIFADYGVRNPNSNDEPKASFDLGKINGKIRYTIDNQYFVVRGYPLGVGLKSHQSHGLAQTIINSEHYLGSEFSWGDKQLSLYSNPNYKPGRLQDWITIDTNHHIETVVMEVLEFKRNLASIRARNSNEKVS